MDVTAQIFPHTRTFMLGFILAHFTPWWIGTPIIVLSLLGYFAVTTIGQQPVVTTVTSLLLSKVPGVDKLKSYFLGSEKAGHGGEGSLTPDTEVFDNTYWPQDDPLPL